MTWSDILRNGWDAIRTHKLRSMLTSLGILMGIAAVVLTVGLGQGAQQQVSKQLASLGGNLLIVSPGSSSTGGVRAGFGSASTLTMADSTALTSKTSAPDVSGVAPILQSSNQSLVNGATNWTTTVVGTTTYWLASIAIGDQKVRISRDAVGTGTNYTTGACGNGTLNCSRIVGDKTDTGVAGANTNARIFWREIPGLKTNP